VEEEKLSQALPPEQAKSSVKKLPGAVVANPDLQVVQSLLRQTGIKSSKVEQDLLAFYQAKRKIAENT
jgi:hypothetical protein